MRDHRNGTRRNIRQVNDAFEFAGSAGVEIIFFVGI